MNMESNVDNSGLDLNEIRTEEKIEENREKESFVQGEVDTEINKNETVTVSEESNPKNTPSLENSVKIDDSPEIPPLRKTIPQSNRNPVTGSGVNLAARRTRGHSYNPNQGGNPITWEGYDEERRPVTSDNAEESISKRKRVPPGGFSSGLW